MSMARTDRQGCFTSWRADAGPQDWPPHWCRSDSTVLGPDNRHQCRRRRERRFIQALYIVSIVLTALSRPQSLAG